jgi:hypothetical protein
MMNYAPDLLAAAYSAGICAGYQELCSDYAVKAHGVATKLNGDEIVAAAYGQVPISKSSGRGLVFELASPPDDVSLKIIVLSGNAVETDFVIGRYRPRIRGSFAILCNKALKQAGLPLPSPAYPRPVCHSARDLAAVLGRLRDLVFALARAAAQISPSTHQPTPLRDPGLFGRRCSRLD